MDDQARHSATAHWYLQGSSQALVVVHTLTADGIVRQQRCVSVVVAKHTEISKYYAAINSAPDASLDVQTLQQLVADRQRAINSSAQMEQTAKALALEVGRSQQRIRELERIAKERT